MDGLSNGTKFVWQQIIRASPRLLGEPDPMNIHVKVTKCHVSRDEECSFSYRMENFIPNGSDLKRIEGGGGSSAGHQPRRDPVANRTG